MSSLRARLRRLASFLGSNLTKPAGRQAARDDEPPANDHDQQLYSSPGTYTRQADDSAESVDTTEHDENPVSDGAVTTDDAQLFNGIIEFSDHWDGTSDLAWLLDEGQDDAPESGVIADESVARAFHDLLGDWERRGGKLNRGDVAILASARGLSATQVGALIDHLETAGVELSETLSRQDSAGHPTTIAGNMRSQRGDSDLLRLYLGEIGRYRLLSAQQEVELWALRVDGTAAEQLLDKDGGDCRPSIAEAHQLQSRIEAGGRAWEALVCSNLRLVVSIARHNRYEGKGVEFADRIQDGNLGLMHAAKKFDGSRGYRFSTYATWWIRQAIERAIANAGRAIRIPVHTVTAMNKIQRIGRNLASQLDREPTLDEIAEKAGIGPGEVAALLDQRRPIVSLDMLLGDEGDLRLSDVLTEDGPDGRTDPANIVVEAAHRADIERVMRSVLPARSVEIVERRYGFHTGETETLDAIGADYGVTRERIRQIVVKSLEQLRESAQVRALVLPGQETHVVPRQRGREGR